MSQYLLAWLIYLAACSVLLWIGWSWTRGIPYAVLRNPLRLMAAVVLLTPVLHEDVAQMLVPAWAVVALAWLAGDREIAVQAGVLLAALALAALLLAVIYSLVFGGRRRRPAPSASESGRTGD